MRVAMVDILAVRVPVLDRAVGMRVAVRPHRHRVMEVVMVPVVVPVHVLVLQRFVPVGVFVAFRQVQGHSRPYQQRR